MINPLILREESYLFIIVHLFYKNFDVLISALIIIRDENKLVCISYQIFHIEYNCRLFVDWNR
jgi:hypothetical protein